MDYWIPVLFTLLLTITHYYSEEIVEGLHIHRAKMLSFAAGISIAYLFIHLLPELYQGIEHLNKLLFLYILIGFVMFHLLEKFVYQHAKKESLLKELKEAHSLVFFIYHFMIGIVLVEFLQISTVEGSLFLIPILFHAGISNISMSEVHVTLLEKQIIRIFLACSTMMGAALAMYVGIPPKLLFSIIAFLAGALFYIVIRDDIPKERKGSPKLFLLGVAIYTSIIILTWVISPMA